MGKPGTFYITTPIYYPSADLHIGHAYTTVAADALARFHRLKGDDVLFATGTDEHGQKIQRAAAAAGVTPQGFVDDVVARIRSLWDLLRISHDDFIRTTEPRHRRVVQTVFSRLHEQGDIYKSEYEGHYCTHCEAFWLERQVVEGDCPDCGRPVELLREESYFLRLSRYADRLLQHIEAHPEFIQPVSRRNEMISFINQGLEDLCVSRTTFDWGINVPFDPEHVVYVWIDALTNYITAAGYLSDEARFERYWPAEVHLVGKEIVRFHTIIWPVVLMALGLPLPRRVFGHGWLVLEGGKISKSRGNVVDPVVLVDKYGVDAVRYYLLREVSFGADGFYSEEALVQRINSDLANDLGNLLYRTLSMLGRFCGCEWPAAGDPEAVDEDVRRLALGVGPRVALQLERLELSDALATIWELVRRCNKYIDETAPWSLARDDPQRPRLGRVMSTLADSLRIVAVCLAPFLPDTALAIWQQLGLDDGPTSTGWQAAGDWDAVPSGTRAHPGPPLFPRLDPAEVLDADEGPDPGDAPAASAEGEGRPDLKATRTEEAEDTMSSESPKTISIDEFGRLDLRVAEVVTAERVAGADRLLKLTVDLGGETRQVVAGIAQVYEPESLVGRRVILVANLEPATIRGVQSQGMVLAAVSGKALSLLTTDKDIGPGVRVR